MSRGPDFIIIGAMKCATSTLHEQLDRQPGIFMSEPKEPNFFSDPDQWARGLPWYEGLFAGAAPGDRCGESSTHYTKLPTYPETVQRIRRHVPEGVRLIYVMRHPVDRLISHYVHEWTQRVIDVPLAEAIDRHRELVDYSRYAMQLEPFIESFGAGSILPVFFERLVRHPQEQLARVWRFLDGAGEARWDDGVAAQNVSARRERSSRMREVLRRVPGLRPLLHLVVPARTWEGLKSRWWRVGTRPTLDPESRQRVEAQLDPDLAQLGRWLGVELSCAAFKEAVDRPDWQWQLSGATVVAT